MIAPTAAPEQWRPLPGHTRDYSISDAGRIRRDTPGRGTAPGRILSVCWTACNPEPRVCISRDGKRVLIAVHRAMVEAFVRPLQKGEIVVPRDGNMRELALSNWCIRSASVRVGMAWRTRYNTTKPKPAPQAIHVARHVPPKAKAPPRATPTPISRPAATTAPRTPATVDPHAADAPFRSGLAAWEAERELRRAGRW